MSAARPGVNRDAAAYSLYCACANGNLRAAQQLHLEFAFTREEALEEGTDAFRGACSEGHLGVAQWLRSEFAITREDVLRYNELAIIVDYDTFADACASGRLDVAQWLQATFALTLEEMTRCDSLAFRLACIGCHLDVARWLQAFDMKSAYLFGRDAQPMLAGGSTQMHDFIYSLYRDRAPWFGNALAEANYEAARARAACQHDVT